MTCAYCKDTIGEKEIYYYISHIEIYLHKGCEEFKPVENCLKFLYAVEGIERDEH